MNIKTLIITATALAAFALPSTASAACNAGVANDLTVVPPAALAEGQTQQQNFTVTACTSLDHVSVEWVKVVQSNQPWMGKFDSSNRTTVVAEKTVPVTTSLNATTGVYTHTGATTFTVPVGLADGHYAVITRYYARGIIEAQGGSSFSIQTPDVCANIDGKQQSIPAGRIDDGNGNCVLPPVDVCANIAGVQTTIPAGRIDDGSGNCVLPPVDVCANIDGLQTTVPAGRIDDGSGNCNLPPVDVCSNIAGVQTTVPAGRIDDGSGNCNLPPVVIVDYCLNLDGQQDSLPTGYTLVAGTCTIIAKPTGETPTPRLPAPWIKKTANVKTTKTGGIIRYTITVGNKGPGTLMAARTCDKLPAGTTYISHTGNAAFTHGSLCVKHGNVAAGKTLRFRIVVKVSGSFHGKRVKNTACVTSSNAAKKCSTAIVKVKVIRREPVGGVTG